MGDDWTVSRSQLRALRLIVDRDGCFTSNRNRGNYVAFATAEALRDRGLARIVLMPGGHFVTATDDGRALLARLASKL